MERNVLAFLLSEKTSPVLLWGWVVLRTVQKCLEAR